MRPRPEKSTPNKKYLFCNTEKKNASPSESDACIKEMNTLSVNQLLTNDNEKDLK